MQAAEGRTQAAGGASAPPAAPSFAPRDALAAAAAAAGSQQQQQQQQQQQAEQQPPVFSCYRYGFRFMASELALLERCFACTGGATPCRADLQRLAATLSAAPARAVEPPHPVSDKQVKARARARVGQWRGSAAARLRAVLFLGYAESPLGRPRATSTAPRGWAPTRRLAGRMHGGHLSACKWGVTRLTRCGLTTNPHPPPCVCAQRARRTVNGVACRRGAWRAGTAAARAEG
jgi:hypothetical protein